MQEQIEKLDINGERALDEIYTYKDQLRLLQEERKRDIEETADFIKQLMDTQKQDLQREIRAAGAEIEGLKKDVMERCSVKEVLSIRQQLAADIQDKVDIKEVQQALNECQNDIGEQLGSFK